MSDFTRMKQILDYVEGLPADTPFDYGSPCRCVFGYARQGLFAYGLSFDEMKAWVGLSDYDFNSLYGGMAVRAPVIIGHSVDNDDRMGICSVMRAYIAQREAEERLPNAVTTPADLELETV